METAVSIVVGLLVQGEYQALENMTDGQRLTAEQIERAVTEYGRTLVRPPVESFSPLDAVKADAVNTPTYHVVVDLWTEEEGRSDLSLELQLTEMGGMGVYDVAILGIHVL